MYDDEYNDYDDNVEETQTYENVWGTAYGLNERGRHDSFSSAIDVVLKDLVRERNDFFDSLPDKWKELFPDLPIKPGRYEDGKIFLYVPNAPLRFAMQPKLRMIKSKLASLPNAPKKIDLRLEIRSRA